MITACPKRRSLTILASGVRTDLHRHRRAQCADAGGCGLCHPDEPFDPRVDPGATACARLGAWADAAHAGTVGTAARAGAGAGDHRACDPAGPAAGMGALVLRQRGGVWVEAADVPVPQPLRAADALCTACGGIGRALARDPAGPHA